MSQAVTEARERMALAQAEVQSAEAEQKKEQRGQWITELKEVREEYRHAKAMHDLLQAQIQPQREKRWNAQKKVIAALKAITNSQRARPAVADHLPNDVEVREWKKHHDALILRRDEAMAARDALPDPDLTAIQANRYRGAAGILVGLQLAEQNLLNRLEGQGPRVRWEGGVFGVS